MVAFQVTQARERPELPMHNSKIEAFWQPLKHSWLYLHSLESVESLLRLIESYVRDHNEVMPHVTFEGQTPDEMYFGGGDAVVVKFATARIEAREERIKANRNLACAACRTDLGSAALQQQRVRSRMYRDAAVTGPSAACQAIGSPAGLCGRTRRRSDRKHPARIFLRHPLPFSSVTG
jgi:hypothetical protein